MGVSVESRTILNDLIQMQREIVDCKEKEEAKKKELADLEVTHQEQVGGVGSCEGACGVIR